ncbi:cyclopropane fatty-acyl-phospholipid synthase-like methyltransferase [Tenacibaculum skagerrakense]|uniref:Cyclopropane fatty-acyl-phospholipid synthase-like methyltransferase n=1 Tax=Tenacibaculum skagerrakense TaxID=186571 RepID=A0A4R2NUG6_9FLAO|nr:class I SAM-dependent methyltransferase [Tenacibaculum skagerrakense]TCP25729.1 cyclopropane fatty-acyl-phospholipid synthase-like methyltransferase [Tenacibaculum skagerrakense]
METKDWFTSWFDTTYYHTLYKNRDDNDAQLFMQNITNFLELPKDAHIADLPCGKGRHSIYLNSLGYRVTGGDLSKNSIEHAKQFENEKLHFEVWDMRKSLENKYDAVFNLFTSFGYFDDDQEDLKVLKGMKSGLKDSGVLVLDFLNVQKTKNNLVEKETKEVDGITFHIEREIRDGFILKHISFFADDQQHSYTEKVKFLDLAKMKHYFNSADLTIINTFGDYNLNEFDEEQSSRLILIAK